MAHKELLARDTISSVHSDFILSSWLLYLFVSPLLFVMYLSPHPDAPTTTPKSTTATTTTTIITTTISYPEINQGTVSPSRNLFISVCLWLCECLCVRSCACMLPCSQCAGSFPVYSHFYSTVAALFSHDVFVFYQVIHWSHHLTAKTNESGAATGMHNPQRKCSIRMLILHVFLAVSSSYMIRSWAIKLGT